MLHPRHRLTQDAVEIAVLPAHGTIAFRPGQFVVLEVELDTGARRSAFSIVQGEGKGITLGIKVAGPGGISSLVNEMTAPIKASLAGPFGQFSLIDGPSEHVFIAAGSGITPVRSLLDPLMERQVVPTILFANRDADSAMYGDSFRALHAAGYIRLVEIFDRNIRKAILQEDLSNAACYVSGPPGLIAQTLDALAEGGVPDDRIQTEEYGLDMGTDQGRDSTFLWKTRWGRDTLIEHRGGDSILHSLLEEEISLPHACEVGVCGACRARVVSGEVLCGKEVRRAGDDTYTCISQPLGTTPATLREPVGSRRDIVSLALIAGAIIMGLWWVPPGLGLRAKGPMNTSHENLSCESCHRPAEGSLRQQLGHNARVAFGLSGGDFMAVGHAPVDNAACLDCHDRPNDRHPVSRFQEMRFAEQRMELGVHECTGCHGEHEGVRVAHVGTTVCQNCHADLEVDFDPVTPTHAELLEAESWETCMQCHDFHGNHVHTVPEKLSSGIPTEQLLEYMEGGIDPYGKEKHHLAPETLPEATP